MSVDSTLGIIVAVASIGLVASVVAALIRARVNLIGLIIPGGRTMGGVATSTTSSTIATASAVATASTVVPTKAVLETLTPGMTRTMERTVGVEISAGIEVPLASIPPLRAATVARAATAPAVVPVPLIDRSCSSWGSVGGSSIITLVAVPLIVHVNAVGGVEMFDNIIDRINTHFVLEGLWHGTLECSVEFCIRERLRLTTSEPPLGLT
jgi:hypothetical protein